MCARQQAADYPIDVQQRFYHALGLGHPQDAGGINRLPKLGRRLYVAGGGDLWWGKRAAWLKCIDATRTGDITKTGEIWSYPLDQHVMSTPAVYNGLVFIADCSGKLHCLDAATGRPCWVHATKGEIWASPLVADGKVYLGTRRKEFLVFAASREKCLLSSIELDSPISATPVAANGTLYVATMQRLYAIRNPGRP